MVLVLVIYFNSIKVRLKPLRQGADKLAELFQFHKGTIKTTDCR